MKTSTPWKSAPISATCEVLVPDGFCDLPTSYCYPAQGGGWMALCSLHGRKRLIPGTEKAVDVIARGERWA